MKETSYDLKNLNEQTELDHAYLRYSLHSLNLDLNIGRCIVVCIHSSIESCAIQINPDIKFIEVRLLKIWLCGKYNLLFGCFYRRPTPISISEENNANLNRLFCYISENDYSHRSFVGDFNFWNFIWQTWTTSHNKEIKEAQFIETIRDCYLH